MVDGQSTEDLANTRRTKRRVDEVGTVSPGKSNKRRQSSRKGGSSTNSASVSRADSASTAVNSGKRRRQSSQRVDAKRAQAQQRSNMTSKPPLNGREQERVTTLLKKANVPKNLITLLEAQLDPTTANAKSTTDDLQEDCSTQSKKVAGSSASQKPTVKQGKRATGNISAQEEEESDEDEDDEDNPNQVDLQDDEYDENNQDRQDSDEELEDTPAYDHGQENGTQLPPIGESDDEQDVVLDVDPDNEYDNLENRVGGHTDDAVTSAPTAAGSQSASPVPTTSGLNTTPTNAGTGRLAGRADIDNSVMLNIVNQLKHSVSQSMSSSLDKVLKEIRGDKESIRKLREHVSELTSIITVTASAMFIKNPSSNPRTKQIQNKLCLLPGLFNDTFMLKVLPRVVLGFIITDTNSSSATSDLESKGIELFCTLYFSKQPNEKKREKYDSDTGRIYSRYRHGLLMSSFLAMQSNVFNTFRMETSPTGLLDAPDLVGAEASTVGPSVTAMLQPFWLKPGYVLGEHCSHAASKQEKRNANDITDEAQNAGDPSQSNGDTDSIDPQESSHSSGKTKLTRTGPLTHNEIATEAAGMVYRIITGILSRSRYASKMQLFNDVLYLFVGWSQYSVLVNQGTLRVQWVATREGDIDYLSDVPRTTAIRTQERRSNIGQEVDKVDLDNIAHLETLIAKHPELTLLIEHDVMVNGTNSRLRYRISLIEVACRSLAAYTTLESVAKGKDALCADKKSLKAVVVLALGLRKMMEKAVVDLNTLAQVPWKNNCSTNRKRGRPKRDCTSSQANSPQSSTYKFHEINGMSLDHFQPSPSKQKEILNQMILNLTEEEFNAKMCTVTGMNTKNDNFGIAVMGNQEGRIEADESQCVFGF